ncbi:MAG: FAD-dependent oxidoreductase, partial [Gammaproteobacteria bacterium]|nr:FAD-dependent oxidoreductase [Gammaproteobacteria bacterium]
MRKAPIVVVGGGVIGLFCAYELVRAGHAVTVLEKGQVGAEASWAAGGILSPLHPWRYPAPVTALAQFGGRAYPGLCESLHGASGIDPEWTPSGLLRLGGDETGRALAWATEFGVALEATSAAQHRGRAPMATDDAALWLPDVAQVRSPRLLRALKGSLVAAGVLVHEQARVERLSWRGSRISGVVVRGEELPAEAVVVASGPWSRALLADYGLALPVHPVRGQMIRIEAPPGLLNTMILKGSHYLIPRRDGAVVVGSTLEETGFEKDVTADARTELREFACDLVPALGSYPVTHQWAGLRPSSPEGVPFIGEHPELTR